VAEIEATIKERNTIHWGCDTGRNWRNAIPPEVSGPCDARGSAQARDPTVTVPRTGGQRLLPVQRRSFDGYQ
jgi:hypothetical protein